MCVGIATLTGAPSPAASDSHSLRILANPTPADQTSSQRQSSPESTRRTSRGAPGIVLGVVAGLIVLAADQGSKWWILYGLDLPDLRQVVLLPVLNLTMVWNNGVTFGLLNGFGAWGHVILAAVALSVVVALVFWLRKAESNVVAVAIGAIAGGAIGNVIDRVRYGAVVDFIHAHVNTPWGDLSWYVFNVADAAIVCGVATLIIESQWPRKFRNAPESQPR